MKIAMDTRVLNKVKAAGRYTTRSVAEAEAARRLIDAGAVVLKRSYPVTAMRPRRHVYRAMELHLKDPA